jgi:hypothetical protein
LISWVKRQLFRSYQIPTWNSAKNYQDKPSLTSRPFVFGHPSVLFAILFIYYAEFLHSLMLPNPAMSLLMKRCIWSLPLSPTSLPTPLHQRLSGPRRPALRPRPFRPQEPRSPSSLSPSVQPFVPSSRSKSQRWLDASSPASSEVSLLPARPSSVTSSSLARLASSRSRSQRRDCHTRFLCQNEVLIVCMTQDHLFHTYSQKCSQITKCHE